MVEMSLPASVSDLTGIARLPLAILGQAPRLGLDPAELMRAASLDALDLRDPDARVLFAKTLRLWRAIAEQRPDPAVAISRRSLQRRLRGHGTSYARLLEDLRREMASELLADRRLAVYEIAFLLGYSEPSAFNRAFRRWTGSAPARYRAGMAGGGRRAGGAA